jgi:ethanolamine phosphate transferase 2 subunit G
MKLLLTFANLVLPVAVLVFASGFFPYKPFIPGLASHKDLEVDHGFLSPPSAKFDRVIFMVIDALRSDFIFSSASGFSFTQK